MAEPVKTIPSSLGRKNLLNLLLPAKNYSYFAQADQYPFEPHAKSHSPVNAWWLAELSLLAYKDADDVEKILNSIQSVGAGRFTWFGSDDQNKRVGTDGYGFETADFAVICFRGTEFYTPADIVQRPSRLMQIVEAVWVDIKAYPKVHTEQEPIFNEKIHTGFYRSLSSVWGQIEEFIKNVGDKPIWVTGHSLGAAIVTLIAYKYPDRIQGMYTYGSPRVGDIKFAQKFKEMPVARQSFRYRHGKDFVTTSLPKILGYRHVGESKHLPAVKEVRNHWSEWLWGALTPMGSVHHAPLYYALHTWNKIPTVDK